MSIIQSLMGSAEGAMAVYIGVGVLILLAGWVADTALAGRTSS
jgi:hypothetical protein